MSNNLKNHLLLEKWAFIAYITDHELLYSGILSLILENVDSTILL